ncbi:hypothetical protein CAPTEDRAFT_217392 [Capitella teleta]|uniref:SWIM-type domain-containing protein n=1 Tax=Capitella teleta TaxID=283909 RepID=R7UFL2_CAPTE|nr:hypothetical protein CAPTEDRAFT_217392 [Capitella teleta]|eukprot:ELU04888.1 hypothetical protein CAPTEDRAFT_217392 [Capitella teleta]
MPVMTIMCVDGNLESRVVAFALISEESRQMYETMFRLFDETNDCSGVQTFMVDKCMAEISALDQIFPHAFVELCHFHVLDAFKRKINSLDCRAEEKDEVRRVVSKLCECRRENEYEEVKEELREASSESFFQYFLRNWDVMKERWVMFARQSRVNFVDRTSNRIESFHQKLKQEVARMGPLDLMFYNILLILRTLDNKITHQNFSSTFRKVPSSRPHLQKVVTPYAHACLVAEVQRSQRFVCRVVPEGVLVREREAQAGEEREAQAGEERETQAGEEHEAQAGEERETQAGEEHEAQAGEEHEAQAGEVLVINVKVCSCSIFRTKLLLCRHILAARSHLNLKLPLLDLIHKRWLQSENPLTITSLVAPAPSISVVQICYRNPLSRPAKHVQAKIITDQIADAVG